MRSDNPSALSPDQRFLEIARVLAAGVRRLLPRPAAAAPGPCPTPEKPGDSEQNGLEVAAVLKLTVHKG